ncbi:MAG: fibronectin type III domain-containing protein [bacterium]|nr:fibronectin type III domain-containing protein [bacterium]
MPGNYDEYVPQMWEQLSWWLDDYLGGERGISTITKHDHYVNIGYARQQAILHASDRRRLHRFLRSIGFEPGDDVVPEELRRALSIWARRLGPVGDRLLRLATDQALEPYADELIRRVAEKWDGNTRDPRTGAPVLPIRVLVEDRPLIIGLAVQRSDDDPTEIDLTGAVSGLQLTSQGSFYTPAPLPLDIAEVLDSGIEISGIGAALTFDPAPLADIGELEAGAKREIPLSGVFSDPDGDSLTISVTTSDRAVVNISTTLDPTTLSATAITVIAVAEGTATITVTAQDPDGNQASDTFTVTVPAAPAELQQAEQTEQAEAPPGQVVNLSARQTHPTRIRVEWDPPQDGGAANSYQVVLTRDGEELSTRRPGAKKQHVVIRKLEPGATYTITVRAKNATGLGPEATAQITLTADEAQ